MFINYKLSGNVEYVGDDYAILHFWILKALDIVRTNGINALNIFDKAVATQNNNGIEVLMEFEFEKYLGDQIKKCNGYSNENIKKYKINLEKLYENFNKLVQNMKNKKSLPTDDLLVINANQGLDIMHSIQLSKSLPVVVKLVNELFADKINKR